jgi:hypothetical protein
VWIGVIVVVVVTSACEWNGCILPSFYVLKLKIWERAENLRKKTGASHRRGELKRFVVTI